MAFQFSTFLRSLTRPRHVSSLTDFSERARVLFSPSDWLVAGALALLMAGGAFAALASVSSALSVEVPMRGGTHVEAVVGSPRFINPLLAISDTDQDLTALVYAGLMRENADGSLTPDLAERYEISDDGTMYTFFISPQATFHDGTRVTANDVVATIKLAQNPEVKSPKRANWDGVEVTKVDDRTITFALPSPYAPFLANTTLGILPAHLWEGVKLEELPFSELNIEPVGAGPYKINKVSRDQSGVLTEVRLVASKHAIKVPYITNFIFRFYPDQGAVRDALDAGAVDAAYGVIPDSKKSFHEAVYARIFAVFMNQSQNAVFTDPVVRRALDAALDKNSLVSTIAGGYGSPLSGPLPPKNAGGDAVSSDHLSDARAILEKDGWVIASTSPVFTKKVKKVETRLAFTLVTADVPELKAAAEAVAEAWRALGAEVKLEFFEQGDLITEVLRPRKYDALLFGEVIGREPDLYAFWHSSQRNDPGLNIALYTNSAVDKLLEAARTEIDPEKRDAKTEEAAGAIAKETAALFLYAPHLIYVTEQTLRGIALSQVATPSDRFANASDWYLKTERVWPIFVPQ
jgi:peptide/nickel transport system substrate-binding protein